MASIKVLQLRPVEDQIEDLSYDITGNIRGGHSATFTSSLNCMGKFVFEILAVVFLHGNSDTFVPKFLEAVGGFLECAGSLEADV